MNGARRDDELPRLAPRAKGGHKGDYGRVLIVGGSRGMAGAPALAGMAALRGGAGLVTVACPDAVLDTVASFEPSYMTLPLPSDSEGRIAHEAAAILAGHVHDVLAIGPGLSQSARLARLVSRVLTDSDRPVVVDADALNMLATNLDVLSLRRSATVLTPHPGEFARLSGLPPEVIAADRIGSAVDFARNHGVVLVLKGAGTVVTDGDRYSVNETGNPGMATGGSGDVLTGLVAAMIGQGLGAWEAARLAVHLHGLAGDLAAEEKSEVSLIARDVIEALPAALRKYGSTPA